MSVHFVSLKGERSHNEDSHNIFIGLNNDNNNIGPGAGAGAGPGAGAGAGAGAGPGEGTGANVNYYGIYDGHGGSFVSKFLSNNLPQFFISNRVKYPLDPKYVNNVYDEIQRILATKHKKEAEECGSTCLVVCHFKDAQGQDFINVMNTGDCRSVLCRGGIAKPLTLDHKPNMPYERARILKLGGEIRKEKNSTTYRIDDLSVSRAFGDLTSSKYVTHKPDIYKYKLAKQDKFLVIACDGLWDVMSSDEVVDYVLRNCYDTDMKLINKKVNIAGKLADKAITELECGDNVTCIVVFFE